MTEEEYIKLSDKYLSGNITADELVLLEDFDPGFEITRYAKIENSDHNEIGKAIFDQIKNKISLDHKGTARRRTYYRIAAAATVILTLGLIFWRTNLQPKEQLASNHYQKDITPGKSEAVLTLSNGHIVILNNVHNGLLAHQGTTAITKQRNGSINYSHDSKTNRGSTIPSFNSIAVPRGGQYQIVLPDGTVVWLNSATTLKYPTSFTGNQRNVELNGEAYFEVAKNKAKPFNVIIGGAKIQVLGTHFDVSNYADEPIIKATLLEGSIKFSTKSTAALLKPGQQGSVLQTSDAISVNNANVDDAVAWKNDYFVFRHENIKSIMRRVSRWYDIEVEYQGNVDNKRFGGSISRFKNLSELLHNMELTGLVRFKIEGRRVIVMA